MIVLIKGIFVNNFVAVEFRLFAVADFTALFLAFLMTSSKGFKGLCGVGVSWSHVYYSFWKGVSEGGEIFGYSIGFFVGEVKWVLV